MSHRVCLPGGGQGTLAAIHVIVLLAVFVEACGNHAAEAFDSDAWIRCGPGASRAAMLEDVKSYVLPRCQTRQEVERLLGPGLQDCIERLPNGNYRWMNVQVVESAESDAVVEWSEVQF